MEKDYWFFMSYAGRDLVLTSKEGSTGDAYLNIFFNDLAKEVAAKAGLLKTRKESEVGFIAGASIETGDIWPDTLVEALQTCRAFICVYSRSYFCSEYCGKEFQVFLDRLNRYNATLPPKTTPPRLIMPVLWEHPDTYPKQLPPALANVQFTHDKFGKAYAENGLNFLMRQKQHEDDYNKFVVNFALHLMREVEAHPVPPLPLPPSIEDVKPAFPVPLEKKRLATAPEDAGPKVARFIFVAGRNAEYLDVRRKLDAYGSDNAREWKPYHPRINEPVGITTQKVAFEENLYYEHAPIDEDFIKRLRDAEASNIIVIIIVDPWSVKLKTYEKQMSDYDLYNFVNCGILIPWNDEDEETKKDGDALKKRIEEIFSRNFVLDNPYIRESISSSEELQKKLTAAIHEVRKRIIQRGRVLRKIESRNTKPLPTVSGTQGGTI